MADRVVACHQPNFLPWLGYFAKMARCDVFVLLDDVQFTQGANRHNWTSRVRIGTSQGAQWLGIPVRRAGEGAQPILDLRSDPNDKRWLTKMLSTLELAYRKMPHAADELPPLLDIIARHDGSVCETNIGLIDHVAQRLDLPARRVRSSTLNVAASSTDRLVELTLAQGGDAYLSGDGADDYQVVERFQAAGIVLRKVGFQHPVYPQRKGQPFVPGLSVVDALCHVGAAETRAMLEPGRQEERHG